SPEASCNRLQTSAAAVRPAAAVIVYTAAALSTRRRNVGATIKDVAREAGVSVATVSRFFNNSGPVKQETAQRIEEVARRMRYAPNSAAQSLSTRRTSTIGVLLPDLHGEFFS